MLKTFGIVLAAAWITSPLSAAVLTFDIAHNVQNEAIFTDYGNRISSFNTGNYSYGTAGGLTPHISISYNSNVTAPTQCSFADSTPCVYWWDNGLGDLTNVIAQGATSGPSMGVIQITLTADPGYLVTLNSFDLTGWPFEGYPTETISSVTVGYGGSYAFSQNNVVVPFANNGHITIAPNVTGHTLMLTINANNLPYYFADNIALDNLEFSQSSNPEPATLSLCGLALVSIGFLRRRRR